MNIDLGDENILWYSKCFYIRGYKIIRGILIKTDASIQFIGKYNTLNFSYNDMVKTTIKRFICLVIYKIYIKKEKYKFIYWSKKC
jgi:hypothetical protein